MVQNIWLALTAHPRLAWLCKERACVQLKFRNNYILCKSTQIFREGSLQKMLLLLERVRHKVPGISHLMLIAARRLAVAMGAALAVVRPVQAANLMAITPPVEVAIATVAAVLAKVKAVVSPALKEALCKKAGAWADRP